MDLLEPDLPPHELYAAFRDAHRRMSMANGRQYKVAAYTYALAELLVRKGVFGIDELDEVRREVEGRLDEQYMDSRVTYKVWDEAPDKYELAEESVEIDCEARMPLCKAACCRLRFALSEQDIGEGIVQWDVTQPYMNRQREDGWCAHNDPETHACGVYEARPFVCRKFDCRKDKRIWLDFENRVVNPEVLEVNRPFVPLTALRQRTGAEPAAAPAAV